MGVEGGVGEIEELLPLHPALSLLLQRFDLQPMIAALDTEGSYLRLIVWCITEL